MYAMKILNFETSINVLVITKNIQSRIIMDFASSRIREVSEWCPTFQIWNANKQQPSDPTHSPNPWMLAEHLI